MPYSLTKLIRITPLEKNNQLNHAIATVCCDNLININAINVKQYSAKEQGFANYITMPQFIQKAHDVVTFKDEKLLNEIKETCINEMSRLRANFYSANKKNKEMSL